MERYLLFRGQKYYANGGIDDLVGDFKTLLEANENDYLFLKKEFEIHESTFDTEKECLEYIRESTWAYIYDTQKKEKVFIR